jgi:hypothetical protein
MTKSHKRVEKKTAPPRDAVDVVVTRKTPEKRAPCLSGTMQGLSLHRYRVGYCRPPRKYRFRPGQTGNPKGRSPRKTLVELLSEGHYRVGYCKAPKDHRFKPGHSGNPAGRPTGRPYLQYWIAKYMAMPTRSWRAAKRRRDLPLNRRLAIKVVQLMLDRGITGATWSWPVIREELIRDGKGKPPQCLPIHDDTTPLTKAEWKKIRRVLKL